MKILVIDDNDRFRQFLIATLEEQLGEIDVVEVTKANLAVALFESDPYFQLIIANLDLKQGSFMEVFQHFQEHGYRVPFITYSNQKQDLGIPHIPTLYKDEDNDFRSFSESLFLQAPFKDKPAPVDQVKEYSRVRLFFFWRFTKVDSPLYVRLSDDKFVKVLHAGEEYGPEFLQKYQDKNQRYFYVEKKDFESLVLSLYKKPLIEDDPSLDPMEKKMRRSQFMQQMVLSVGVTPDVIENAEKDIEEIINEAKNKKTLAKLLLILEKSGSYNSDHSTLLCYVTAAMCDEMGWSTRRSKEKLAFAALFHDVTLIDPRLAVLNYRSIQGLERFDRETQKRFKEHPLKASELVVEITAKYPQVDTIIAQHHERPDGSGFPYGKDYNQILPLSSLFIVAHDFVSRVYEKNFNLNNPQEILDEMVPEYRLGQFSRCMLALQSVLTKDQIEED